MAATQSALERQRRQGPQVDLNPCRRRFPIPPRTVAAAFIEYGASFAADGRLEVEKLRKAQTAQLVDRMHQFVGLPLLIPLSSLAGVWGIGGAWNQAGTAAIDLTALVAVAVFLLVARFTRRRVQHGRTDSVWSVAEPERSAVAVGVGIHHQARAAAGDMGDDGGPPMDLGDRAEVDRERQLDLLAFAQPEVGGLDEDAGGAEIDCTTEFFAPAGDGDVHGGARPVTGVQTALHMQGLVRRRVPVHQFPLARGDYAVPRAVVAGEST